MADLPYSPAPAASAGLLATLSAPFRSGALAHPKVRVALLLLVPILLLTVFAPLLPIQKPLETNLRAMMEFPSIAHPFGTDKMGRDILSRTLAGVQISMLVGVSVASIALLSGMLLGTLAGFYGGKVDRVIMTIVDIFLAFPSLLLAIGLVSVMGTGLIPVILAISLADVPRFIRLQRSQVLSLRTRAFIDAARTVDASQFWLMSRHIVPNTLAPMLVAASIAAANAILIEASLSFLGLGIMPPSPSLGNIVRDGQMYLEQAWWISTLPGVVILLITIGLHFLSDGVRELLDPRARR
jgi:peptide/nickel transport system permease protein